MDLVGIGTSAVLSALLFIVLELTVILPLIKRIVTDALNDEMIPKLEAYIVDKTTKLTEDLTKSLYAKIRGMFGGSRKGSNAIINRLMAGEDPDDIEDDYAPASWEAALEIIDAGLPMLAKSIQSWSNGKKKDDKEKRAALSAAQENDQKEIFS